MDPATLGLRAYLEATNLIHQEYAPGEDLVAIQDLITDLLALGLLKGMAPRELLDRAESAFIAKLEDQEETN
jgi:hypothetical protein